MYKNRNLGAYIAFVINPRENFDFVASGSKKSGIRVESELEKGLKIIIMVLFQKSWDFLVMKIIENGGNILYKKSEKYSRFVHLDFQLKRD